MRIGISLKGENTPLKREPALKRGSSDRFQLGNERFNTMSGTGLNRYRYPDDLLNRASTVALGKPIVIGRAWEIGRVATFEIKHQEMSFGGRHARRNRRRARARQASAGNA